MFVCFSWSDRNTIAFPNCPHVLPKNTFSIITKNITNEIDDKYSKMHTSKYCYIVITQSHNPIKITYKYILYAIEISSILCHSIIY